MYLRFAFVVLTGKPNNFKESSLLLRVHHVRDETSAPDFSEVRGQSDLSEQFLMQAAFPSHFLSACTGTHSWYVVWNWLQWLAVCGVPCLPALNEGKNYVSYFEYLMEYFVFNSTLSENSRCWKSLECSCSFQLWCYILPSFYLLLLCFCYFPSKMWQLKTLTESQNPNLSTGALKLQLLGPLCPASPVLSV